MQTERGTIGCIQTDLFHVFFYFGTIQTGSIIYMFYTFFELYNL